MRYVSGEEGAARCETSGRGRSCPCSCGLCHGVFPCLSRPVCPLFKFASRRLTTRALSVTRSVGLCDLYNARKAALPFRRVIARGRKQGHPRTEAVAGCSTGKNIMSWKERCKVSCSTAKATCFPMVSFPFEFGKVRWCCRAKCIALQVILARCITSSSGKTVDLLLGEGSNYKLVFRKLQAALERKTLVPCIICPKSRHYKNRRLKLCLCYQSRKPTATCRPSKCHFKPTFHPEGVLEVYREETYDFAQIIIAWHA